MTTLSLQTILRGVLAVACVTAPLRADDEILCWKQSYGRGVGLVGKMCPSGQVNESGLCYPACPAGYTGAGPLCWQTCPDGFANMGVSCTKPAPTSSAGYPWKFGDTAFDFDTGPRARCEADNGAGNCYRSGLIWYPKCKANFHKVGDLVCSPDCPAGMRDDGAFCAKQTKGRGAGEVPGCGTGMVSDAGLCYPACGQGFGGVGPVCWGSCPAEFPSQCGAACAKSAGACATAVGDMVLNTVGVAVNILSFAFGGPGVSVAAKSAATAGRTAAAQSVIKYSGRTLSEGISKGMQQYAKSYALQFVKTTVKNQVNPVNLMWRAAGLTKTGGLKAMNMAATDFGILKESNTFDLSMLTALDPTGIAAMVYSFAKYPSCSGEDFAVSSKEIDFGNVATATGDTKTIKITAQQPMTITSMVSPALSNCTITPEADCIGKRLTVGQTCDVKINLKANVGVDSELRIYTTEYTVIPYPIHLKANTGMNGTCLAVPGADETANLTSITGAWAFDNDQSHIVAVTSSGAVQAWAGNGTVSIKDAAQRSFEFRFGSYNPAVVTLDSTSNELTGTVNGRPFTAVRRPWDASCPTGQQLVAGLCYNVPPGYAVTAPGFMGTPCPADWRDDGSSCWPPWTGVTVAAQADKEGIYTMRHPLMVTDCDNFSTVKGGKCPANFANNAPLGCTCTAQITSKQVKSIIGTPPR